mgnify:CR=1 FL=1
MGDRYAVFGNPIEHSYSPLIHRQFALQTHQSLDYQRKLIPLGDFSKSVDRFFSDGGCGLNITLPFKTEAHDYAQQLTDRAVRAGAANILTCDEKGTVVGDNSDGFGLISDIRKNLGWRIAGRRILILGAGGAVRGILDPLLSQEPATVMIANRTAEKALDLVRTFSGQGNLSGGGYDVLETKKFDAVINGTSASLVGPALSLPDNLLIKNQSFCYDMMYGSSSTGLVRWAKSRGVQAADGLGMLVEQAAESFFVWRGVRPSTEPVIKLLRETLTGV